MTRFNLRELTDTGQWLLATLFARFPKEAHGHARYEMSMIVNGVELEDINPTIDQAAKEIYAYCERRAQEILEDKVAEIASIVDDEIDILIEAIRERVRKIREV